jgi:hypothetical protein
MSIGNVDGCRRGGSRQASRGFGDQSGDVDQAGEYGGGSGSLGGLHRAVCRRARGLVVHRAHRAEAVATSTFIAMGIGGVQQRHRYKRHGADLAKQPECCDGSQRTA